MLKFGTFRLWKDLQDHWRQFMSNPLVKHLVESPAEPFIDPVPRQKVDLDAVSARCPIPADGSQLRAVARAALGQTFVLEGPSGTGKSQTITNLLATALAEGKKVLFVAEKQAALDVVKRRHRFFRPRSKSGRQPPIERSRECHSAGKSALRPSSTRCRASFGPVRPSTRTR
jgi:hypothetical protein